MIFVNVLRAGLEKEADVTQAGERNGDNSVASEEEETEITDNLGVHTPPSLLHLLNSCDIHT